MAQIDDFFMYENRVEGITDADYQRAKPYVEAAQAFAQTTYQSIYIIDYYRKNFLYVSDNPLFLCGHTADEVRQMGYGFYLSHVPEDEVVMLSPTEILQRLKLDTKNRSNATLLGSYLHRNGFERGKGEQRRRYMIGILTARA